MQLICVVCLQFVNPVTGVSEGGSLLQSNALLKGVTHARVVKSLESHTSGNPSKLSLAEVTQHVEDLGMFVEQSGKTPNSWDQNALGVFVTIKSMIMGQLNPWVKQTHDDAVAQYRSDVRANQACADEKNSRFAADGDITFTNRTVSELEHKHSECRKAEWSWTNLKDVLFDHVAIMSGAPTMTIPALAKDYFDILGQATTAIAQYHAYPPVTSQNDAVNCGHDQSNFEEAYCALRAKQLEACSGYDTCAGLVAGSWSTKRAEFIADMRTRQDLYRGLIKVVCRMDELEKNFNATSTSNCDQQAVAVSVQHLDWTLPADPESLPCVAEQLWPQHAPQPSKTLMGDSASATCSTFLTAEFNWLLSDPESPAGVVVEDGEYHMPVTSCQRTCMAAHVPDSYCVDAPEYASDCGFFKHHATACGFHDNFDSCNDCCSCDSSPKCSAFGRCAAGQIAHQRNTSCQPCEENQVTNAQRTQCGEVCAEGLKPDRTGINCVADCPDAHFSNSIGECELCLEGVPTANKQGCELCPSGKTTASDDCVCEAGAEPDGGSCSPCATSEFSPIGDIPCTECPTGKVVAVGKDSCECPSGHRPVGLTCASCGTNQVSLAGAAGCTTCVGQRLPSADTSMCVCPTGHIPDDTSAQATAAGMCTSCAFNETSDFGDGHCTTCQAGTVANTDGDICVCAAGHGVNASAPTGCSLCAVGKVSPLGDDACKQCQHGQKPNADKSTCVFHCPAGQENNEHNNACKLCPADKISTDGDTPCSTCPSHKVPNLQQGACVCPDGHAANHTGGCDVCASGWVAHDGSNCSKCGGGTQPAANAAACICHEDKIFSGGFCVCPVAAEPSAAGGCQNCSTGWASPLGDTPCLECPSGTVASADKSLCVVPTPTPPPTPATSTPTGICGQPLVLNGDWTMYDHSSICGRGSPSGVVCAKIPQDVPINNYAPKILDYKDKNLSMVVGSMIAFCTLDADGRPFLCDEGQGESQKAPDKKMKFIDSGYMIHIGIDIDDNFHTWGKQMETWELLPPTDLGKVQQAAIRDHAWCALKTDQKWHCQGLYWGSSYDNQKNSDGLGHSEQMLAASPNEPMGWTSLYVGQSQMCGVRARDSVIECWPDVCEPMFDKRIGCEPEADAEFYWDPRGVKAKQLEGWYQHNFCAVLLDDTVRCRVTEEKEISFHTDAGAQAVGKVLDIVSFFKSFCARVQSDTFRCWTSYTSASYPTLTFPSVGYWEFSVPDINGCDEE